MQKVIKAAKRSGIVVIGAAPASGKTSILALAGTWLDENEPTKVVHYLVGRVSAADLLSDFRDKTGIEEHHAKGLWVLIDDAQNAYSPEYERFWQFVVKHPHGNTHILIATTYDLRTEGSPVVFYSMQHFSELGLTSDECDQLFVALSRAGTSKELFFAQWDRYKAELAELGRGHIGVFTQGIRMLQLEWTNTPRSQTPSEDTALGMLRGQDYLTHLKRCYPGKKELTPAQHGRVLDAIMGGAAEAMDADEGASSEVQRLQHGGVMASDGGGFTCRAATSYYINCLFPGRATGPPPTSIEALVVETVKTMSASRLRTAKDQDDKFAKEAAFQQMFFVGLATPLPPSSCVISEKSTFIPDASGESVLSGELDSYINSDLQWALELVRKGDKIGGHLERFNAVKGKYREVNPRAYLVVDCRPGPITHVQRVTNRCTLFFSDDFKNCEYYTHEDEAMVLQLQD